MLMFFYSAKGLGAFHDYFLISWLVPVYFDVFNRDGPIYQCGCYIYLSIFLTSVGVDKTQTTCARKHDEPSQDSYLAATLAGAFS